MTILVPLGKSDDGELEPLRARLAELETTLKERVADITRVKTELASFKINYRQLVGRLHEELDEIEDAIAAAELGHIARRMEGASADPGPSSAGSAEDTAPQFTSDAVRRLFRDVAKAIHPDLAEDEQTRNRRHALMIEANEAYALGDEERLRLILQSWERSPEAVQGSDPEAVRLRLVRRIEQLEQELARDAGELDELKDSPMWQLKAMVDEAAANGKDLIADMVRRLRTDIMIARNKLAAIEWTR